jgi:hypothetical protein
MISVFVSCSFTSPSDIDVRLGEWEINNQVEPLGYVDHRVMAMRIHPEYKSGPEYNDIAVLVLETPIVRNHHVNTACMPESPIETYSGKRCVATGWGKDAFNGKHVITGILVYMSITHHYHELRWVQT